MPALKPWMASLLMLPTSKGEFLRYLCSTYYEKLRIFLFFNVCKFWKIHGSSISKFLWGKINSMEREYLSGSVRIFKKYLPIFELSLCNLKVSQISFMNKTEIRSDKTTRMNTYLKVIRRPFAASRLLNSCLVTTRRLLPNKYLTWHLHEDSWQVSDDRPMTVW